MRFLVLLFLLLPACGDYFNDGILDNHGGLIGGHANGNADGGASDAPPACNSPDEAPLRMEAHVLTEGGGTAPVPPAMLVLLNDDCVDEPRGESCLSTASGTVRFLNPAIRWSVETSIPDDGDGCYVGREDCRREVGRVSFSYRVSEWEEIEALISARCNILVRPNDDGDRRLARALSAMEACSEQAGFNYEDGNVTFSLVDRTAEEKAQVAQCMMEACAAHNRWPTNDYSVPNPDGDNLGPACDCVDKPEDESRCNTQPVEGGPIVPGFEECRPGQAEPVCAATDRWPDFEAFVNEQINGGSMNEGPGLAEDLGPEIEYTHEDGEGGVVECFPGRAICQQAQAVRNPRQRGRDYEEWLCRRQKRKSPGTICRNGRGSRSASGYRTAAGQWELPPQLSHNRARRIFLTEGRLRFPDYTIPPTRRNHYFQVLGEAKCYNPYIDWDPSRGWSWLSAVGFGTQLYDYLNKLMEGRRSGRGVVVNYHFCDLIPRRIAYEIAGAYAYTAANGFNVNVRDTPPGANWIMAPGCYVDMADALFTVAPHLFECFVPGAIGGDPMESCIGAFYDECSGSE